MKRDVFSECADGHYNKSGGCSQQCGHCAGRAFCDKNTGYCPSCEPGWIFPHCQQRKSFYCFILLYIFIQSPSPPPPPPFLRPARWLQTSTACPNCLPRVGCWRPSPAPVHAGTTYPFLCQRNPLSDLLRPAFKLFFFCYVFPSHAASFLRRKLLLTV